MFDAAFFSLILFVIIEKERFAKWQMIFSPRGKVTSYSKIFPNNIKPTADQIAIRF